MTRKERLDSLEQERDAAWGAYLKADQHVERARIKRELLEELTAEARAQEWACLENRAAAGREHSAACEALNQVHREAR